MKILPRSTEAKETHLAFELVIIAKGVYAVLETIAGLSLLFLSRDLITRTITLIGQEEISEDSKDAVAQFLLQFASHFTISTQHFAAAYLLAHGLIKIFLIVNLLRERLWAFPVAIGAFGLFVIYQLYRYTLTHSPWLIFLSAFDALVVWLAWREYHFRKIPLDRLK